MNSQISITEAISRSGLEVIDLLILLAYLIILISLGLFLSSSKDGKQKGANDYFLAGNTLTWWAVGASLIAANISTEQIVGMAGTGYADGIAIAAYELMGGITLLIVGKFLLPIMMERKIFTMPQFLRRRYNNTVGMTFSILWLFLYIFVNLTSVAWLGAMALEQIMGVQGLSVTWMGITISTRTILVLTLFFIAGLYSIHGGMEAVAWTDVVQIIFIIGGGLTTAYFAIQAVAGDHEIWLHGLHNLFNFMLDCENQNDVHFHLIVQESHNPGAFSNVPGIAAIVGGLWLTNLSYFGFNQFITQKGLAAENTLQAQKGFVFAGFLKTLTPFIAVLPGICAFYLMQTSEEHAASLQGTIYVSDNAYPWLIRNFIPTGIRGLAVVSLVAAIISSLASVINSTAAIFTIDIYRNINKGASGKQLMNIGRAASVIALFIAAVAAYPLLGNLDQAFQYIQEYSGLIYPGLVIVFGLGLLWKRASTTAAIWTSICTIPLGVFFKLCLPDVPFLFRSGYVFIALSILFVTLSLSSRKMQNTTAVAAAQYKVLTRWSYILGAIAVASLMAATYVTMGTVLQSLDATPDNNFIAYLNDIGFQAFYFFAFLTGICSLCLALNARQTTKDPKALPINLTLFSTPRSYAIGSIIICAITLTLYIYLW